MQTLNKTSCKVLDKLTDGLTSDNPHKCINNEPWVKLVVEIIGHVDNCGKNGGDLISMAHYLDVELGDDPQVDPEVCFVKCEIPDVNAMKKGQIKYIMAYFPYYVKFLTGKECVYGIQEESGMTWNGDLYGQKDLASFCNVWCKNIKEQGFLEAKL